MTQVSPLHPNSTAENELEQEAFALFNDHSLPERVRNLIGKLWAEVVAREQWHQSN